MNETIDTPAPESANIIVPVVLTTLAAIGAVVVIKKTISYASWFTKEVQDNLALARALKDRPLPLSH